MNLRIQSIFLSLAGLLYAAASLAQSTVSEDFTGAGTTNTWYYSGGACLTARGNTAGTGTEFTSTVAGAPGIIPGCGAIDNNSDAYGGETLVGGVSGTLPDTPSNGALRFTNGCINGNCTSGSGGGHNQFGAIISGGTFSSSAGVQVTFKTVTYRGDSGGSANDGADGLSFFLQDASVNPNIGQYGGSLAYTCSNTNGNYGYGGMVGGYIGLGIDEYGNFLNGAYNTLGETGSTGTSGNNNDNTASGGLYQPNRIGMRGAGNVAWSWLNANYPSYYPSTLTTSQQAAAVQNTCITGTLWNYAGSTAVNTGLTKTGTKPALLDYAAIPNAYTVLSGVTIANEYSNGGLYRVPTPATATNGATPIFYKVKITSAGLLSLNYSINGGNWTSVLANQSILASNGTLPANVRFGFAGSTGGSSNIHEVLCFKAAAADASSSSTTSNQTQSSRVTSSTQAYFSYYDPNDWTGRLTANAVSSDASGNLTISPVATWDGACVLTGGSSCSTTGVTTANTAENWQATGGVTGIANRAILTWNYTTGAGAPFQFSSLSVAQQAALNVADSNGTTRLNYLRGDRSNELTTNSSGLTTGLYRDRDSVLGDIVDSSPVAVGQPVLPYAQTWKDKLYASTTMPENSGSQSYTQFITAEQTRENMVYVGANDGMVHGFRAGAFTSTNTFSSATNDGTEVIAYVPGAVINSAVASRGWTPCLSSDTVTQTAVQNIHGVTPVIGSYAACAQPTLDYSNSQYGHNFFIDATPASGDLFYGSSASNEQWHTWLVGGLGAGGGAIYALDITTPANFSEGNASSLVIGEWTAASISCSNSPAISNCGNNLGSTYGTPLIRRMHNGMWAIIFGNGFGSSTGDAGIFVITINPASGAQSTYYLSAGQSGTSDGIAYVTSADLDGDHVTDFLYAGDLNGNVWRFDVTSNTATTWGASGTVLKLFTTQTGQPITSSLLVAAVTGNSPGTQVMVAFGTGRKTLPTNISGVSYSSAQQSLYAVWDPNFSTWNTNVTSAQYASLSTVPSLTISNLTAQTLSTGLANTLDITSNAICWAGASGCTGTAARYGWYANLVGTNEQIIFNPQLVGSAFSVNSLIPANNTAISCTTNSDTGYTYAISLATGSLPSANGGGTQTIFGNTTSTTTTNGVTTTTTIANTDSGAVGLLTNATGTSTQMTTSTTAASSAITTSGTGNSVSCTLGGACNSLPTSLVMYPGPFSSVSGCSAGDSYLVYQTTTAGAQATRVTPNCPLVGSRTTRSQIR
jgi:type IV pilus assembly protein PilY1